MYFFFCNKKMLICVLNLLIKFYISKQINESLNISICFDDIFIYIHFYNLFTYL